MARQAAWRAASGRAASHCRMWPQATAACGPQATAACGLPASHSPRVARKPQFAQVCNAL